MVWGRRVLWLVALSDKKLPKVIQSWLLLLRALGVVQPTLRSPGLLARSLALDMRETTGWCFYCTSMFVSLSFSLPSSLSKKINKSSRIKIIKLYKKSKLSKIINSIRVEKNQTDGKLTKEPKTVCNTEGEIEMKRKGNVLLLCACTARDRN